MSKEENMEEYQFTVFKANLIYSDYEKEEIYLKMIKGGKVKETIFCFWSWLCEEYVKNKMEKIKDISKKTIITQKNSYENSSIMLTLSQNLDYCAEINLVELKNFIAKNIDEKKWGEKFNLKSEDILFIGRKKQ